MSKVHTKNLNLDENSDIEPDTDRRKDASTKAREVSEAAMQVNAKTPDSIGAVSR